MADTLSHRIHEQKISKVSNGEIRYVKQTEILTHVTRFPAVYMSYICQNFRLFHVSNLSVRNFRVFLLMYPGPMTISRRVSSRLGRTVSLSAAGLAARRLCRTPHAASAARHRPATAPVPREGSVLVHCSLFSTLCLTRSGEREREV